MPDGPTLVKWAVVFAAGFVASAINAFAGGGSLVSFPALVAAGMPELNAVATNTVALCTGNFTGALAFLNRFGATKRHLLPMIPVTAVGSVLGTLLLVMTPNGAFKVAVPFLVLVGTLVLAFQTRLKPRGDRVTRGLWLMLALQFVVSIYGGYFGAGMGIMMLASMGLAIDADIHELNALKNWLTLIINLVSAVVLLWKGLVDIPIALALMAGGVLGGYVSGKWSQKVDPQRLRVGIVGYGLVMTGWFFWRAFAR